MIVSIIASLVLAVVSYRFGYTSGVNDTKKKWSEYFKQYYTMGHHNCIDTFVSCGIMKKATGERLKKRFERDIKERNENVYAARS